jgi:hypothetical protein
LVLFEYWLDVMSDRTLVDRELYRLVHNGRRISLKENPR